MTRTESGVGVSRRRVLRTLGAVGMVGLAGCSRSQAEPVSPTDGSGGGSGSVFQSLSFDLGDLVIGLPEDHGVSRISLLNPDGTVFTSVSPDFAATTARMAVADPEIGRTGYTHYIPGMNELVAKTGDESERQTLSLRPDLSITGVSRFLGRSRPTDAGRVVIRIANQGTAPTWPYQISFEGAPNWTANDPIVEPIGIPLEGEVAKKELIVPPSGEQEFVSTSAPLLYEEDDSVRCVGEQATFRVLVGTMVGPTLSTRVRATANGELNPATLSGQSVCTDSSVQVVNES